MFAKFILTVAVVALIWFGFRFVQRLNQRNTRPVPRQGGDRPRFTPEPDGETVRDLVKCPICNTWRPASAGPCGRAECPN